MTMTGAFTCSSVSQREERLEKGSWHEVVRATGGAECPAVSCRRIPASLNTDDNMLIELRAPSDLIGFSRYEGYLSVFYGQDWPGRTHTSSHRPLSQLPQHLQPVGQHCCGGGHTTWQSSLHCCGMTLADATPAKAA